MVKLDSSLDRELETLDRMIRDMNRTDTTRRGGLKKKSSKKVKKTTDTKKRRVRRVRRSRGGAKSLHRRRANKDDDDDEDELSSLTGPSCGCSGGKKRKVSKKSSKKTRKGSKKTRKGSKKTRKGGARRKTVAKARRIAKKRTASKVKKAARKTKRHDGGAKKAKRTAEVRHFKVVELDGKKTDFGYAKLKSGSPLRVARKLLRSICAERKLKGNAKINCKASFKIQETTQGSKHKVYGPYHGHYVRIEKKDQQEARGGIIPKFKAVVKLV